MATFVNVFVSYQISDHCLTLWSGFLEMTEVMFLWRLSLLHKSSVRALLKSSPGLCLHAGKILLFHFWAVVCFCCAGFYCRCNLMMFVLYKSKARHAQCLKNLIETITHPHYLSSASWTIWQQDICHVSHLQPILSELWACAACDASCWSAVSWKSWR